MALMARSDTEFHDFVVGFADPLSRLAYLLTDGAAVSSSASTVDALVRVRRQWREAETTGSPESLAVEALVAGLPRHWQLPHQSPHADPRDIDTDMTVAAKTDAMSVGEIDAAVSDVIWTSWRRLEPRHRVPLVFADLSVASRRLAELDVPESFGPVRKSAAIADETVRAIRVDLAADLRTRAAAAAMSDVAIVDRLLVVLRLRGAAAAVPHDPYPMVTSRARELRRRTLGAVSVVGVLVIAGSVAVATLSAGHKAKSPLAEKPRPVVVPADQLATGSRLNVAWPTRGNAADDTTLIDRLKLMFARAHPEASDDVQVLVLADTAAFRIAYLTANSVNGVIQSWFSGPVGASELFEGAFSFGGSVQADSVIATTLTNSVGKAELAVIARPTANDMNLAIVDPTLNVEPAYRTLASTDGVAFKDVPLSTGAKFALTVRIDGRNVAIGHVPDVQIGSNSVERGTSAPDLLAAALLAANSWTSGGGPPVTGQRVALWGGVDPTGNDIIAVRIRTASVADGLLIDWSGAPELDGSADPKIRHVEYFLLSPSVPDFPLGFRYGDGLIGLVVPIPTTFARAALVIDGNEGPQVTIDGNGFASLSMAAAGAAADTPVQVDVFDPTGNFLRVSLPTRA